MKLALWQTHPRSSIASALTALREAATSAATQGADVLITPEMFVGGYNIGPERIATHADHAAQVLDSLKSTAKTQDIALVVGLTLPAHPLPHNACVIIDNTGTEVARYHKTHLFGDVDRAQFSAGAALSEVFDLAGWKVALAICYDVEFPELIRSLALRGAEVILTPTANMEPFDTINTRLVPARAEENGVYVAYCNYIGAEAQFTYNGLSCLSGPDGQDHVRAEKTEAMLFATLDRADLTRARQSQTHLQDRRPDLYGDIT